MKKNKSADQLIDYYYDNKINQVFATRISNYFSAIKRWLPFIKFFDFTINSVNTFPHSAGIASSASFFGSLALCLVDMERQVTANKLTDPEFLRKSSFIARLGSGSASRSIYGGFCLWGQSKQFLGSSDEIALPVNDLIHTVFRDLKDDVLIIDEGRKQVSSSKGHAMMYTNPYAEQRFAQANQNLGDLLEVLKKGDVEQFITIVENEALSLHAMMLTSKPGYFLIRPETVSVINDLRDFRDNSGVPVLFTLDAGPNVHILYPDSVSDQVRDYVDTRLLGYSPMRKLIRDRVGSGPVRIGV